MNENETENYELESTSLQHPFTRQSDTIVEMIP